MVTPAILRQSEDAFCTEERREAGEFSSIRLPVES
jgi:hypothetical protein